MDMDCNRWQALAGEMCTLFDIMIDPAQLITLQFKESNKITAILVELSDVIVKHDVTTSIVQSGF